MLDNETKPPHINDAKNIKTFLTTMVELSNRCRSEERTLYLGEVHSEFQKLGLATDVRAGAHVGNTMSANAINNRVKKSLSAIKDLALSAGNISEEVEKEFARLSDAKRGIMKVKETLDIGDNQPMALFQDLNSFLR
tara:strand:- start:336 stop:746 length:411 start_codon:yes stop_codon:yes gene_type:complete